MSDAGARARSYHEATKHSVASLNAEPHHLDWENQPLPFKVYGDLEGPELSKDFAPGGVSALDAVARPPEAVNAGKAVTLRALARVLHFSLGVIRRRELGDGRVHDFRAAPCTGALYHIDAYVVCGALPDLAAGVYHFGPHDFRLRRLRAGDFRGVLADASGREARIAAAPVTLVLASTYWRNAWKYRSRAWRHVFWDGGTILAQLLAEAAADGWPVGPVVGFADAPVEALCGLDPKREGVVALVPLGTGAAVPAPPASLPRIDFATRPLSRTEIDYPLIREAHAASSLADGEAARRWRARTPPPAETTPGSEVTLPPPAEAKDPLEKVILRRGSTRRFARRPISGAALGTLLDAASAPLAADYRSRPDASLVDLFVIVNAVDGVPPGAYRWHPARRALEQLSAGEHRREAGYLALGQALAADASVNVYAIADLDRVLGALGDRGYRAAQLDGGTGGGRVYLAAYAQRLGVTGLTFFDDDVTRFFGLDPGRFGVMILSAAGVPSRL